MVNTVKVRKNQLAMFHTHELTDSEVDYLIRHFPISLLNSLIKTENETSAIVGHDSISSRILASLASKVDVFDR